MNRKKILVVDDVESIAKIITLTMRNTHDVFWIEDSIKATQWMEEGNVPDLIISDLYMPLEKGDKFLNRVKAHPLYKYIPFFILSGEDSTSERVRLLSEGADDFVVKPFNPLELKIRINKFLS